MKNLQFKRLKRRLAAKLVITNKERLQLLHLNADKDRFIAILAHDLKSPFNSILGFLDLLAGILKNTTMIKLKNS